MKDNKEIKNSTAQETENTESQQNDAKEKAMSSEAIKVSMYGDKKMPADFDDEEFMKPLSYWERKKRERKANKVVRAKHVRRKLTKVEKALLVLLGIALVCVGIYFTYYYLHYVKYDGYKQYISSYDYEEGVAYKALADEDVNVEGYQLVAESEYLKLYTDTKTASVAIYDKRNGETVYTNPPKTDEDNIANPSNKDIMKSQLVVYYYNDDVISSVFNSYADSVVKGNYKFESITNGIRYIYTIGDGNANFQIPLEYRLNDDYIEVSIKPDHIVETGSGYIYRIQMLRYMAATSYDDNGYMVVPNGSGSIINFNNGKINAPQYSSYIYDIDPLASNYTTLETLEVNRLPIFGVCKEDRSVLVSVEDGAADCVITAGVSGAFSDYNYAYPTFVTRNTDNLKMFGDSTTDVYVMEPNLYNSEMCVRYTLLDQENKGYAGIANYYRNRLVNEGVFTEKTEKKDIPFYYDVIAAVKETGHFLGVQYLHSFSMTSFKEAGEMADYFNEQGISNQVMNLQGWFNDGYYHDSVKNVKVMNKLGGKKELNALSNKLEGYGGTLYGDAAILHVTFADKYFPYQNEASRYYGAGYVANFGLVNPTTLRNTTGLGYTENKYNMLSPKFLPRYMDSFIKKSQNLGISGYSLRDLGNEIASDKKRTCMIEREEALDIILGQYEKLDNTGKKLMTNGANAYTFAYTDDILNAPIEATKYDITDETIPLYEMIVHGYINYSSELLNFENEDEKDRTILTLIENGASPHYVFTMEESSRMKLTSLNRFYSTTFDIWKDSSAETYKEINEVLKKVSGSCIINHEILSEDLRKVTYDNGVIIYVNYGASSEEVDGITIDAKSIKVEG